MSRGTDYLNLVTQRLQVRIGDLGEKIQEVQKDIEGMHEYYWENYTEMDQYGYENFDNQQALLTQINANDENLKMRHRLRRMLDSPFFGSVDFVYDGEDEAEVFYIGIGNFAEKTGQVPLVYDWRAPVSGLFYDYDTGAAAYEAPGGRMEGEILSKWQYKIRGGRMVYEFESDMKIDDDILKQELGANSDTQLKNIVRTIQKEQNAIIRNTKDKILVIQGAAGSGKTSVALHRIAYLLYHDRERLKSSNILILSQSGVFSDYISHILPELGEENIQEMSFDLFAYRELQDVVADCEDRFDYIENRIRISGMTEDSGQWKNSEETDGKNCAEKYRSAEKYGSAEKYDSTETGKWKQSAEFVRAVEGFLVELEDRLVDFRNVEYKGFSRKDTEILSLFYYKFPEVPLLSRMEAVMENFVDEYETLYSKTLKEDELALIREKFQRMYVTTDVYRIYNWLLEDCGLPTLADVPREQRFLEYEDVYPVLYLKYRLCTGKNRRNIRHLVIDEMQDYSYLQYVILQRLFSCNMTILGDRAQTVDEQWQDVQTFLPRIFGRQVKKIEMKKSYRNTAQIAEYAAKIAQITGIEYFERHGKAVTETMMKDLAAAMEEVCRQINLGRDGYETAAVLTMTEQEARACFSCLQEQSKITDTSVSYIDRDSSVFKKGITVTTFYQAKGLEFDQVFVIGGDHENAFFRQFRYISATRALHELYVYDIVK